MNLLLTILIFTVLNDLCFGEEDDIRKCCGLNEYVHVVRERKGCMGFSEGESLDLGQAKVYDEDLEEIGHLNDFFNLTPGFFLESDNNKQSFIYSFGNLFSAYHLIEDGRVFLSQNNTVIAKIDNTDKYCIDYSGNNTIKEIAVFYTVQSELPDTSKVVTYSFLISSIFLLLLLVVYGILPELRNLSGKILMAYAASLMICFLCFFSLKIRDDSPSLTMCLISTFLAYYSTLASFCWMNIMSYNIWQTYRGYLKGRLVTQDRRVNFQFAVYCSYAFGLPLVMTIALAILNKIKSDLPDVVRPRIPERGCFLSSDVTQVYLYGPMLPMIIVNWLFFATTVSTISRLGKTEIASGEEAAVSEIPPAIRSKKYRLLICLELSMVMGISWIMEILSSFFPKLWYIWQYFDAYNNFIGIFLFIIYVCKKEIYISLKKKFSKTKGSISNNSSNGDNQTIPDPNSEFQSIPLKPPADTSDADETEPPL